MKKHNQIDAVDANRIGITLVAESKGIKENAHTAVLYLDEEY